MKKLLLCISLVGLLTSFLVACNGQGNELADMKSCIVQTGVTEVRAVVWEGRTYVPFCVVSKDTRGRQVGYVDGDQEDRISEYKGYPPEDWLVSWLPLDGGAMLLREESVVEIPEGLEAEYQ